MTGTAARTRLFVEDDLGPDLAVGLDRARAHYLQKVLRLGAGDLVALFNGRDGEWLARIDGFGRGWVSLLLVAQTRVQAPAGDIWLLFAPLKRARVDFLVEKATELGATRLCPVMTRRTVVDRANLERFRLTAIEAAEQCERLEIPTVAERNTLADALADWPGQRPLLAGFEAGPAPALADVVAETGWTGAGPIALLIGPEGGFAPEEQASLRAHPAVRPFGLGRRVLRAETAGLAALAILQGLSQGAAERPVGREVSDIIEETAG